MEIREGLTFDDVLLQPGPSEVLPADANVSTRIASDVGLNIPVMAAAMDTVSESGMAIAMAQAGGLAVIHRNLTIAEQAEEVRRVKRFESGMVVNPVTISPDATLAEVMATMTRSRHRHLPVVENGRVRGLVSIGDVVRQRLAEMTTEAGVLRDIYLASR